MGLGYFRSGTILLIAAEVEAVLLAIISTRGAVGLVVDNQAVVSTWRKIRQSGWHRELAEATSWLEICVQDTVTSGVSADRWICKRSLDWLQAWTCHAK
eukprot:2778277-Amphidinium_carterae.3